MEKRYERNIPSVSPEEQAVLKEKHVLVAGCGGLGGYVIEYLARMGVGELTIVDGDVFEATNLNRQLNSAPAVFGKSKAEAAAERIHWIDPGIRVNAVNAFLDRSNADELIRNVDLAADALDNVPSRFILEDVCAVHGVPIVHGAIQGWSAQASVILPGDNTLHRLYGSEGASSGKTSLPFTPAFCAAVEAAEAVKLLCGRPSSLAGKLLSVDLRYMEWDVIPLK